MRSIVGKAAGEDDAVRERMREIANERRRFGYRRLARWIIKAWRADYNTMRPHSGLGGLVPTEFTNCPRQGHMNTEADL